MPTPTSGDFKQTYLHFFINNGQRYCGIPGIYHAKIDNGIFGAIKDRVEQSDIPAAEVGENDTRLYGVLLRNEEDLAAAVWNNGRFEYQNQPPESHGTNSPREMHIATNGEVYRHGPKLDQLLEKVDALAAQITALTA